jgi:hypothetical protein
MVVLHCTDGVVWPPLLIFSSYSLAALRCTARAPLRQQTRENEGSARRGFHRVPRTNQGKHAADGVARVRTDQGVLYWLRACHRLESDFSRTCSLSLSLEGAP